MVLSLDQSMLAVDTEVPSYMAAHKSPEGSVVVVPLMSRVCSPTLMPYAGIVSVSSRIVNDYRTLDECYCV